MNPALVVSILPRSKSSSCPDVDGVARDDVSVDVAMGVGIGVVVFVARGGVSDSPVIAVDAVETGLISDAWPIVTGAGKGTYDFVTVGGAIVAV